MAASLSWFDVATCVDRCKFATGCCETHCNGCMNVAWAMFWGGAPNLAFFCVKCSALASRSGFGAAIADTVARSSIVFCNSVSADRIVMAASRLLGAAAACVILLSFAAEDRKIVLEWLHPGCDSDLSADFRNFGASNFPFKILFKKCFKIVFLSLWRRDPVP